MPKDPKKVGLMKRGSNLAKSSNNPNTNIEESKNTDDEFNQNKKLFDESYEYSDDGGSPDLFYEDYDDVDEDELAVFESEN